VVHRDISPENILLTSQGEVKLIDFGIALDNERRSVSRTGIVKGKLGYMSPEQAGANTVDRRTDIYAIGIMGFELMSNKSLYKEGTTEEIRQRIVKAEDPILPTGVIPHKGVEELLAKAVCANPDDRYATASAFRQAVENALSDLDWSTDRSALAEIINAARGALDKAKEKKKKLEQAAYSKPVPKQPAAAKSKAKPPKKKAAKKKPVKVRNTAVFPMPTMLRWCAHASMALLISAFLLEIFGVSFGLPS